MFFMILLSQNIAVLQQHDIIQGFSVPLEEGTFFGTAELQEEPDRTDTGGDWREMWHLAVL